MFKNPLEFPVFYGSKIYYNNTNNNNDNEEHKSEGKENKLGSIDYAEQEENDSKYYIENRRGKIFGHLIRHDDFFKTILEKKIEGKSERGRSRRNYIDQIKKKYRMRRLRS